jgi:hypothetical protein
MNSNYFLGILIALNVWITISNGKSVNEDAIEILDTPDKSELDKKEYRFGKKL